MRPAASPDYAGPVAARRLLILLLLLFGFSTLAAALIPVPPPVDRTTSSVAGTEKRSSSRIVEHTIDAGSRRPSRIRLRDGDFLRLTVRSERVTQVEIPRLGVLEDVGPYDSATLALAPPDAGAYAVRLEDDGRVIARVRVGAAASGCCRRG